MKIGIALSTRGDAGVARAGFVQAMRDVEAVGLDGLWFFDAIGRGYLNTDPLGAAAAAGAVTERI
ncbi:MAG: hypothetical protein RIM80_00460, partial [Alphaproteobacteria bacterium]